MISEVCLSVINYSVKDLMEFSHVNFQHNFFCSNFVATHVTLSFILCTDNPCRFNLLLDVQRTFLFPSLLLTLLPIHCRCRKLLLPSITLSANRNGQ
jgi:hypothetical protein